MSKANPRKFVYTLHELIELNHKFDWTLFVTLQLLDIYTTTYKGLQYNVLEERNPLIW